MSKSLGWVECAENRESGDNVIPCLCLLCKCVAWIDNISDIMLVYNSYVFLVHSASEIDPERGDSLLFFCVGSLNSCDSCVGLCFTRLVRFSGFQLLLVF